MSPQTVFKFEVTLEEGDLIVKSLSKQPFEAVAVLIAKLQKQALDQTQAAQPEAITEG
jgi:hypothetical protein